MRFTIAWVAVALLGQALLGTCEQTTEVVSSTAQLLQALNNPNVSFIWVNQSMKLPAPGSQPVYINHNVTISGPIPVVRDSQHDASSTTPAAPAAAPSAALSLDFGHQQGGFVLGPGVLLIFQHLQLLRTVASWGPFLASIDNSARSRIRMHNVIRSFYFCPTSLEWLNQQVESTPVPAGYTPPPELHDQNVLGPFRQSIISWNLSQCKQRWLYPDTCINMGGFFARGALEVASSQNDKLVYYSDGVAWFEYYDVYIPCLKIISDGCVRKKGYVACFNDQMRWVIWQEKMMECKWQLAVGALVTVAAIWASSMWLHQQRQRQRQVDRERQLHAAAQAPVGAAVPGGGMPAICVHVSKTGALQNVVLGRLIGAGSFGRVYTGEWNGQRVAVKVMELRAGKQLRVVRHELDINMLLRHPNVVRCHDYRVSNQDAGNPEGEAVAEGDDSIFSGPGCVSTSASADCGQENIKGSSNPSSSGAGGSQAARSVSIISQHTSQAASGGLGPGSRLVESAADRFGQTHPESMVQAMLLLEYCDKGSLNTAVRSGLLRRHVIGSSPVSNMVSVLRVALDVARGMAHLHANKVCHGDLSSNNVLLCTNPDVPAPLGVVAKVADFGLSRLLPDHGTHLSTLTCGTITHAAPEVLKSSQLRLMSDVYSYGILLWELVHLGTPKQPTSRCDASSTGPDGHAKGSSGAATTDPRSGGQPSLSSEKSSLWDSARASPPFVGDASTMGSQALTSRLSSPDSQPGSSRVPLITSVYQDLRAAPWTIATKVMEGMRPVFCAPAVPGPYIQLAHQCWQAEPAQRPTFEEIVALLEAVMEGDDSAGASSGPGAAAPYPPCLVESF